MNTITDQNKIQSEQIRQLFSGFPLTLVSGVTLAIVLAYSAWGLFSPALVIVWLVMIVLVSLARAALVLAYWRAMPIQTPAIWLKRFRLGVFATATVWGLSGVMFFSASDVMHQMFLIFVLSGFAAGGIIAYSVDIVCAVPFVIAALAPFMIRLFGEGGSYFTTMGITVAVFIAYLIVSMRRVYRNTTDNIVMQIQAVTRANDLAESETKLRTFYDSTSDAVMLLDGGKFFDCNQSTLNLFGCATREQFCTKHPADLSPPEQPSGANSLMLAERQIDTAIKNGSHRFEWVHKRIDTSETFPAEVLLNTMELHGKTILHATVRNITERKKAEETLMLHKLVIDTASDGFWLADAAGNLLEVNAAYATMSGYTMDELVGMHVSQLEAKEATPEEVQAHIEKIVAQGHEQFETRHRHKDGHEIDIEVSATFMPESQRFFVFCRDIGNRKISEQKINQLAFYDPLTQLPNRRLLMDRLQHAMAVSLRNNRHGALLFLDLDHFKNINDTQGHAMGDQLLVEVAQRLQASVRKSDSVARLGGDEFVILLEGLSGQLNEAAAQAELVAEKIGKSLAQPYLLKNYECLATTSIGICLLFGYRENVEDLFRHADVAMYQAKTAGRNTYRFFDPKMQAILELRAELQTALRHALEKQQLRLYYQIQVDKLRRPLGAEVLLRWIHPERGMISPAQFIPLAEETGLIVPIGLWVLQTACAQLKIWQGDVSTRDLTLAVNVSAKQFRQADFVAVVQRVLMESGAKPSHLKLELTESIVLENVEDTINKMHELKLLGVNFSMDDFGTGHSSLSYLKRLPLDQIKIDQSFVRDIASDPNDAAIVQTIIAMTEKLGLNVIAEGVETQSQLEFLESSGCNAYQGYLFSKPIPLEDFETLLRKH